MVLMKKFLIIAVMMLISLPLFGFNVDFGAISNKNGTVSEYVSAYCDEFTLDDLNVSQADINGIFSSACSNVVESLRLIFASKINSDTDLNVETKQNYLRNFVFSSQLLENKFFITINYGSVEVWKYFCVQENLTTQEFHYFFLTYDVINTIKPRISSIAVNNIVYTTPQFVYNLLCDAIITELGQGAEEAINEPEYSYSYVTTKRRVHSNAEEMFYNDGFYYHTWSIEDIDNSTITIYSTYANSVVWYLFALSLTGIFLIVIVIKSKKSKLKNQIEEN